MAIESHTYTISLNEYRIRMQIWDTAGQEKYRSLTQIFYKDASIAILVYDITNEESFDEIQNYWIEQIRESAPKNIGKYINLIFFI